MKLIIPPIPNWIYTPNFWCNKYSSVSINGAIISYLAQLENSKTLAIPYGDGLLEDNSYSYSGYDENIIVAVLCARPTTTIKNKLLLMPIDDQIFEHGLTKILEQDIPNINLPWKDRIPIAFFRGACNTATQLRKDVIALLHGFKHSDALFVRTPYSSRDDWFGNKGNVIKYYDKRYTGSCQPVSLTEFINHKYIIIIDGYLISSSLQWIFGSGSVPILITNPLTDFWFKHLLIPFENYVPIDHTLGDLKSTIQYLVDNDDVAERIAKNAKEFSKKIFSNEFQKEYLSNFFNNNSEQNPLESTNYL
jgi:hypothetical protein